MGTGKIRNAEFKAISMGKLNNDMSLEIRITQTNKDKTSFNKGTAKYYEREIKIW